MKRFMSVLISVFLLFSCAAFSGCSDNTEELGRLKEELVSLRALLEDVDLSEVTELKAQVTTLESTVTELNGKISSLESLTEQLEGIISDSTSGNAALQTQIVALTTSVSELTETLKSSVKKTEALETEVSSLHDEYNEAVADILNLKNRVTTLESDKADLQAQIDELTRQGSIDSARITALETTKAELQADIDSLTDQYNDATSGNAALKKRIDELQKKYDDSESGNLALKAQIASLLSTVSSMQETIEQNNSNITSLQSNVSQLQTDVSSMQTTISGLNTDLTDALTRIQLLEGVVETDKDKVYNMGDWFTFKSNGLELFRVQLVEYGFMTDSTTRYVLRLNTQNISMPTTLAKSNFLMIYACNMNYVESETGKVVPQYYPQNDVFDLPLTDEIQKSEAILGNGTLQPSDITHFILGIPNNGPNQFSIIPYAIYKM